VLLSLVLASPSRGQSPDSVSVDGLLVTFVSMGLEARSPEHPVIVFESGGGGRGGWDSWYPILSQVARFAPLLAYDRSGQGSTPWDSVPPTPVHQVQQLHRLLEQLHVPPPYVLVGHSWGGALIHQFGVSYPNEVTGMVYIDPTDYTWGPEESRALLESLSGDGWLEWYDAREREQERAARSLPLAARGRVEAQEEYMGTAYRPPDGVPVSVIKAADTQAAGPILRGDPAVTFDSRAYFDAFVDAREDRLRTWVRPGGEFVIANTGQHLVHHFEPDLVVEVIQRVVAAAQRTTAQPLRP
jgi:pimeloyl-ACP methyl ester carboxylesterase